MKRLALLGSLICAGLLQAGCGGPPPAEDTSVSTSSAALSGEQVYEVANVYNTGVAMGFMTTFASITPGGTSYWPTLSSNLSTSYFQVQQFWPGGPVAGGAHGAAITYDGKPLPTFAEPQPYFDSNAYSLAESDNNDLDAILIQRTPYAAYYSLGALIAMAETQAAYSGVVPSWPASQQPWDLAVSFLDQATNLANSLCRPSRDVWKTAFNVQEMRDLRAALPSGPNQVILDGFGTNPAQKFHDRLATIRAHLGSVVSSPATLETGVHGLGCIAY